MNRRNDVPRRARRAWLALLTVAAGPVLAQSPAPAPAAPAEAPAPAAPALPPNPPMATPAAPTVFAIRGFQVEGDNPLGDGETSQVLAPFLRANATIETLQQATAALETALRNKGFGLHRVALPPQEVGDTVKLTIVTFAIGKIDIAGAKIYDEANVRLTVPELKEGASPNFRVLAVQTAIANENPNKQVQVGLRESEQPDRIDATISVREQKPWTLGASLSNAGSKSSGRDRFTLTGGHTNLFNLDHQFQGAYTTSFEKPGDVRQIGLQYRVPLYKLGGVLGLSYTHSDVVGNFGTFTSTGAGHTAGISYTAYLPPEGGRRSYVTIALDDKVFDAARINDIIVPGALSRRSRPLSLGYTARTESDTSVWGYNADLAFNTGSGSGNTLAAYQSEDPRIDTARWKALRGGIYYTAPAFEKWLWAARGAWQYSPDVLVSGEQFGLGGQGSVRGTEVERPLSGDRGLSGSLELTTPELATGLRVLGFVDAGWIGNNNPTSLAKPGSDRVASVGLGLRYTTGVFALQADYGRIVLGSKVPLTVNMSAPQKGDDRLYLNLSVRF